MEELIFELDDISSSLFSERRLELLREIMRREFESIRKLAEELNRDVKNVWQDLSLFEKHGLIEFECHGRRKVPRLKSKKIVILFRC